MRIALKPENVTETMLDMHTVGIHELRSGS
jgi:hypothetical protein